MRILIVDDDKDKRDDIVELLRSVEGIIVDESQNVFEAKEKLMKNYYDLLILDINLPYSEEDQCSEDAGYLLYKEIRQIKIMKKPGTIVFVTSYDELQEKYSEEISKGLFSIVKYCSFDNEWKDRIRNKVNYILKSSEDAVDLTTNGYEYNLAIITAVQVEFDQVKRLLKEPKQVLLKGDPTYYISGYFIEGNKKVRVVIAMQHQMGIASASVLTTKLINNFKPRYMCMVGIAAGKRGEGNYGDIIIPTEVWDYGSGKITESDENMDETNNFLFKPDPKYLDLEVEIKELLNKDYTKILDEIKSEWPGNSPSTSLQVVKGPMACGSVVVQNEDIIKKYIDPYNRKLKGIDMESYGVFYAVENAYRPKPSVIVCKSICDFGDKDKNNTYQSYAAYTSAKFLYYLATQELF